MSHDHIPPPPARSRAQTWVSLLSVPLAIVGGFLGWGLVQASLTAPSPTASVSMPSADADLTRLIAALASPQAITVTLPDVLVVTTPTPVPLPPRPPQTTPVGLDICTDNTPKGVVCKQPKPPLPPPTAIPDCPVEVGKNCVSQGRAVTWVPSPTPGPVMASSAPGHN